MMRRALAVLSGLIFLLGAMVIVGAFAAAWLYVIAAAAEQSNWLVAAAIFVASLWAGRRYEAALRTPWELWHALWLTIDQEIERRTR